MGNREVFLEEQSYRMVSHSDRVWREIRELGKKGASVLITDDLIPVLSFINGLEIHERLKVGQSGWPFVRSSYSIPKRFMCR